MANDDKIKLWIHVADVKAIPLNINPEEENSYREAEKLVNTLWNKWSPLFKDTSSNEEVMARVAFQFARLYAQTYSDNVAVNDFLTDFEKKLDDIVIKI